jgi:hypothetical protein
MPFRAAAAEFHLSYPVWKRVREESLSPDQPKGNPAKPRHLLDADERALVARLTFRKAAERFHISHPKWAAIRESSGLNNLRKRPVPPMTRRERWVLNRAAYLKKLHGLGKSPVYKFTGPHYTALDGYREKDRVSAPVH